MKIMRRGLFWCASIVLGLGFGLCWPQDGLGLWRAEQLSDLPWVKQARERNEQRRPVCSQQLQEAERLIQQNPRDEKAWETIGRCKLKEGAADEAASAFRRIIRMNSGRADAYSLLGFALLQKGEREYAREMFEAAIKNDPNEDQAYRGLGAYQAAVGNPRAAVENYEQALKLANPQGPNLFNPDEDYRTVAFLYAKLGQPQLTVKAFERAVQVYPIDEEIRFQYGLALAAVGQREKALAEAKLLQQSGHRKLANELAAKVPTQ